ncbi:hypothetical protein E4U17_001795 [Claviceps sp. LM77 group G4]|nr:hypothetical protein E4U17_001795 [Claviceps sp. LM77 group G4]KAG6078990.1 hypothetical protein E4U16_001341 [Claviceps sp. LM84 group G4]KAG6086337.1 hypothetical protein E4U33_006156 [Claviceps sp. LM78 group G4]
MKFSTVLGTFALSALEANRALASPLEPFSLEAQSLEERDTEYCCFQISTSQGVQSKFVPYTGGDVEIASFGACEIYISQGMRPRPSQGGCNKYMVTAASCPTSLKISVAPAPAVNCQQ